MLFTIPRAALIRAYALQPTHPGCAPAPGRLVLRNCDAASAQVDSRQLDPNEPACGRPNDRSCGRFHRSAGLCEDWQQLRRVPVLAGGDAPRENAPPPQLRFGSEAACRTSLLMLAVSSGYDPFWSPCRLGPIRSIATS